ncbi:MAG: hypothetical protein FJY85_10800 [Deltaproteobacteria bacterium]|nr:hypothetical protein [Deltaproteobacteria bacterium]
MLAWGAVPNTELIQQEGLDHVVTRIRNGLNLLEKAGVDRSAATRRAIVTPACGCAGMSQRDAERVYQLLSELESSAVAEVFGT